MSRNMFIDKLFPFVRWERSASSVRADFIAGLTVALVLIPQSMAYAQLAGLPVVVGLYASFLPVIFGALWGCSHHLQTGPVAMTSLLTATALMPLAVPETAEYVMLAGVLALLIGVIRLVIGLGRMTVVANFLSKPVMDGFVNAGALVIASSQVSKLFGLSMPRSNWYLRDLWNLMLDLPNLNWIALVLSVGSILMLVLLKKYYPKLPAALFVVVLSTLAVWGFGLWDESRVGSPVGIVGHIPRGLPALRGVTLNWAHIGQMIPGALAITFIGFMEMCGVAKAVAARSKQSLDLNQEMVGQGVASLSAGLSGGYPISGSFSRTALNYSAGAKTGLSSVFTGLIVALFLMFLAGTLHYLPKAALGAIIIVAVVKLLDFRQLFSYWKISRIEGVTALFTFVATLSLAPQLQNGILAGAALSIFIYLFSTMKPNVCWLNRMADGQWACVKRAKDAMDPLFPVLRFDGRLFFANVSYFETEVLRLQEACPQARCIAIESSGINSMDATGVEMVEELADQLKENGVRLIFCGAKAAIHAVFDRSCTKERLGEESFFERLDDAREWAYSNR